MAGEVAATTADADGATAWPSSVDLVGTKSIGRSDFTSLDLSVASRYGHIQKNVRNHSQATWAHMGRR